MNVSAGVFSAVGHRFAVVAVLSLSLVFVLNCTSPAVAHETEGDKQEIDAKSNPKVLDISEHYGEPDPGFQKFFRSFSGKQIVDGLPFAIDGAMALYGKSTASRGDENIDAARGIEVGRKFDELYLIHHTFWPDVDGETVASVYLNYADGTKFVIPLRYGVHLRDWFNVPSFEKEKVTDVNTTICWRRAPVQYKAPVRLFKSRIVNPLQGKVVETIDFVSARNLSSYSLIAATVIDTAAAQGDKLVTDRNFDGKISVSVVDDATGEPIEKALVQISMTVEEQGVVGTPFYTSSDGEGAVAYPTEHTKSIYARVSKDGYRPNSKSWRNLMPGKATIRLVAVGE